MKTGRNYSVGGRSLILNALFVVFNLMGLSSVVLGSLPYFSNYFLLMNFLGFIVIAISSSALFILHGRLMMANVSKIIVGTILIVSGLIKINDPIGFSYKLKEYFQDGAIAYRIKELFGSPSFSLEGFIGSALFLAVVFAILEIVLGVLLIIGGRIKWIMAFLLPLMLFFTFLTYHTSNCSANRKYTDRNEYPLTSTKAQELIQNDKNDHTIKAVSKNNGLLIIDEKKSVQCVSDCGCFGDAMQGSTGRSLTPLESFIKDLVLLYFIIWIIISTKFNQPTTARTNLKFSIYALVFIGLFALLFKWSFLAYFPAVLFICALWIKRDGGYFLGNYFGSSIIVGALSLLVVLYVLRFDSIKDFRPYAVGNNLQWKTMDGKEGKVVSYLKYVNKQTKEELIYRSPSREYSNSRIWENKMWIFKSMKQKTILAAKSPSITDQFDPTISIDDLGPEERQLAFIQEIFLQSKVHQYNLEHLRSKEVFTVDEVDYNKLDFPDSLFAIKSERYVEQHNLSQISIRKLLFEGRKVFLLVVESVDKFDIQNLDRIKTIYRACKRKEVPFIMITSSSRKEINEFRRMNNFHVPVFSNDETELKVIARINPTLMILEKGVVSDKFTNRSIPKVETIKKKYL
ncbi:MAG: DoxX family protein [Bacteroidota bacterium]